MGEIEPDGQYLPDDAEHDTQVDEDNAPRVVEYLPAAQSRQVSTAVAPTAAENLPAPQLTQVLATEAPIAVEYLPAAQATHNEPTSEYVPARQFTQSVQASDPDGDDVPARQFKHVAAVVAAVVVEYLPTGQAIQSAEPA